MREILSGALGTFAFSVLMQVPRRLLFFTTFGGLLSGTVYRFAEENGMGAFGATLWGMLAVALYAELLARVLKTPSTVLLYPSTVPLLPGSAIYYAMQYLLWGHFPNFTVFINSSITYDSSSSESIKHFKKEIVRLSN